MSTAEKIAVMQAFEDGKAVEYKVMNANWLNKNSVLTSNNPTWNWFSYDYRIKPAPASQLDRIKAEYAEYEVCLCHWGEFGNSNIWVCKPYRFDHDTCHVSAQSHRGFYRYVYELKDGSFHTDEDPTAREHDGTLQPCAVLFTK